ncbi:unnamed protein product [Lampetra fluviatilis]
MADESTEPGAAEAAAEVAATPTPPLPGARKKVDVLLKAVGDAPIMKQKKWSVETGKTVAWIIQFVRKYIKCDAADSLFLYVNQSFAPAPDQDVGTLFECFGSDGKLVLHYCKTQANAPGSRTLSRARLEELGRSRLLPPPNRSVEFV